MRTNTDIAWVAGLFEGEGCIHNRAKNSIAVTVSMTDLDVLERISRTYGGRVTPLKVRKEHWKPAWVWTLHGRNAYEFLQEVIPHFGTRRSARAQEAIERYRKAGLERAGKYKVRKEILELWETGKYTEKKIGELTGTNRSYVNSVRMGKMKLE